MKLYITIICCFILCLNAKSQSIERIMAIDAFEFVQLRDTTNTIIIDGRSDEMFANEHIQGAINIDAFSDLLNPELKKHLEAEQIIVYCTNQNRAELIIEKLKEFQYDGKIIFIADGISAWISLGYKTVSN